MRPQLDPQKLIAPFNQRELVPRYRLGLVVSIQDNRTITVTVGGASTQITGVKYLGSLQPVPNDPIWLVADGTDLFALGVLAAEGRTFAPRASRSTTQSIADATDEAVTFDAVNSDDWGSWSAGQATRVYAKMTGRYIATATVHFAGNATGLRSAWIEKTATTTYGRVQVLSAGAGSPTWLTVSTTAFDMTADTDYVRLLVRQNSGGPLNLNTSSTVSPALSLIYLGP